MIVKSHFKTILILLNMIFFYIMERALAHGMRVILELCHVTNIFDDTFDN